MGFLTLLYRITTSVSIVAVCLGVALPRASALSLDVGRSLAQAHGAPLTRPSSNASVATEVVSRNYQAHRANAAQTAKEEAREQEQEQPEALPGIAGAPPPQSGVAQLLPDKAPLSLHSVPGWCHQGTEPRAASLRARGFARLARRSIYEEEVISQPADPLEWACTHPWSAWFLYAIVIWAVGTAIAFLLASFFLRGRVPKYDDRSAANPEETFSSGHFGCLSDYQTCLMAFFCPVIRWADTVHMAGVLSFWFAFWILSACYLPSLAFFIVWGLFPLVPMVIARQQLRDKIGLPSGNETWVSDCCFAFWCSCCLIAQEARVVNEAYVVGHTSMPVSGGRAD